MSRPIKFRVWDKRKKEWFPIKNTMCLILNTESTDLCFITKQGPYPIPQTGQEDGGLNRYVLEQFTGLLDSEGKEIYEGDILAFLEGDFQRGQDGFDDRLEVVWDGKNSKFGANFYSKYGGEGCTGKEQCLSEYNKEIIIIGNIHQNHELLAA